ncbi:transglycosylase SLT domain-containing protein [Streptomyces sp. UNOC14_S4]|uniref:transglycosylase SLT domain-containing protein n=1 Tax=Streptomyces sp. UNOC14_S4 TaxID=2872340 RepID=UPI001E39591C|nr:transglycosylase SLT domain-containing protein [Streptomyces sp. UNOC14_S4]MCC3768021.1 transglycosylase SLT domain-containing protein [Streptomyces sp. UNOC14_S4]
MRSTGHYPRLTKLHKISAAGLTAAGAAAVALAAIPGQASAAQAIDVKPVAWTAHAAGQDKGQEQLTGTATKAAEQAKADAAKAKADKDRAAQTASRSEERKPVKQAPAAPAKKAYSNDLDGWINEALDVMAANNIPGSYDGIKRNIMRESTGNPNAINDWDVNAAAGIPSKGLLQIIDPTFKAYHVDGTSWNIYDPVANIVASCNYAAKTYGSMDNVNSAY